MSIAGTGAIDKAMLLLELVSASDTGLSYVDLERATGMPRATVSRIANALVKHGLLIRRPGGGVCIGPRVRALAKRTERQSVLPALAKPILRGLRTRTGEFALFAERREDWLVYADAVRSRRNIRITATLGGRVPLHATAIGQAYLAALPEEEADEVISSLSLKVYSAVTPTTAQAVADRLAWTREQGVAVSQGELDEGVWGFGVAVCVADGCPVAALGVSMPEGLAREGGGQQVIQELLDAKQEFEEQIQGAKQVVGAKRREYVSKEFSAAVVDDDPTVRRFLRTTLERLGARVTVYGTCEQALNGICQDVPAIVITDVRMPGKMNGIALAEQIVERFSDVQVLLISGYSSSEESRFPFLAKPFSSPDLQCALQSMIAN